MSCAAVIIPEPGLIPATGRVWFGCFLLCVQKELSSRTWQRGALPALQICHVSPSKGWGEKDTGYLLPLATPVLLIHCTVMARGMWAVFSLLVQPFQSIFLQSPSCTMELGDQFFSTTGLLGGRRNVKNTNLLFPMYLSSHTEFVSLF